MPVFVEFGGADAEFVEAGFVSFEGDLLSRVRDWGGDSYPSSLTAGAFQSVLSFPALMFK